MTTPKEALIHAKVALENEIVTLFERETLNIIQAAIPAAELHEQAAEFLEVLQSFDMEQWYTFAGEIGAEIPKDIQSLEDLEWSGSFTDDGRYTYPARQNLLKCIADVLLTKLEALR